MQNIEINFGVRPCIVTQNGEEKKALLYIGGCPEGQMSMIFGLVEYNDGTMGEVNPSQIRFVDNKIKDYAFEEG